MERHLFHIAAHSMTNQQGLCTAILHYTDLFVNKHVDIIVCKLEALMFFFWFSVCGNPF